MSWAQAPEVGLYDTGSALKGAPDAGLLETRAGWSKREEESKEAIRGDAAVINDRMGVVFRKGASCADLYVCVDGKWSLRGGMTPVTYAANGTVTESTEFRISGMQIVQNDEASVALDVAFAGRGGAAAAVRFEMGPGLPILTTKSVKGAGGLRLNATSRVGLIPDFVGNDTLTEAAAMEGRRAVVTSSSCFLLMAGDGDLVFAMVWDKNVRDLEVTLDGKGEERKITGAEAAYGDGGKIWIAPLSGKGVWHRAEIAKEKEGKIVTPVWSIPFNAEWRCDLVKADHRADTWDFKYNLKDRRMNGQTVGAYLYPCWIEEAGKRMTARIQTPRYEQAEYTAEYGGYGVIYPLKRIAKAEGVSPTPLDKFTVLDVLRETLGIGPCPGGTFMLMHQSGGEE